MRKALALLLLWALPAGGWAVEGQHACGLMACDPVTVDLDDRASLQRGARLFVNYCLSCHSASYMRYEHVARDLGIPEELMRGNLMFAAERLGDLMTVAMRRQDAAEWFGAAPPDLTLVTRWRSPAWVYTFLRSFYRDPAAPSGWNNLVFPNVAMPHVLYELQGEQRAVYEAGADTARAAENGQAIEPADAMPVLRGLELARPGSRKPQEYASDLRDLTNFLVYLGEPAKLVRYRVGAYVLVFLAVFLFVAYLLKKEYWKGIH